MPEARRYSVLELARQGLLRVEDGNHGEYRPRPHEFVDQGVAFIRAADLNASGIDFDGASKINATAVARITKGIGEPGDVILSHKGTVGKVAMAPLDAPSYVCSPQTTFWRSLNPNLLDQRFLHVFLRSPDFRAQLESRSGETDMAGYVSLTAQRSFWVPMPPIDYQRAIVGIVGAIDDKIELNRRMNETLEAMARAIFKDWFVDFGPTRAKVESCLPYLAPEVWSLFPDQLNDEDKPEGWCVAQLIEICQLKRGYDLPEKARTPGHIPIVSSSGTSGSHSEAKVQGPGIVTGRYGTIGQVFTCLTDFWPLNTTLYVRDFKRNPYWFVYHTLVGLDYTKYSDKAAVPGVNRNALHMEPVTLPPYSLRKAFEDVAASLMKAVHANSGQSRTLSATRDLLLPKLMSGEIRLRDAGEGGRGDGVTPVPYHKGGFPPAALDWSRLIPLIGPANAAIARLEGVLHGVPNPDVLLSPLTSQEAVLSSRIEGTQATLGEVLEFEAQGDLFDESTPKKQDIREVLNYRAALREADALLNTLPLSQRLIKRTHEVLMEGVRGRSKSPGEYRRVPNWIGPAGCTLDDARFVPCGANDLQPAMDAWERYLHTEPWDQLVQLAIAHAEFEAIHPFLDGNGRLGRLIVPLFLKSTGLLSRPNFYISEYLESHRDEYYERLLAVSRDGDWTGWSLFFLKALIEQAKVNQAKAQAILALYQRCKDWIAAVTHSQYAVRALDWMFGRPIFRTSDFVATADIPKPTASRILRIVRDEGMLVEVLPSRGRRAAVLAFAELLNIAEGQEVI